MTPALSPLRERWLLLTLAGVQFTHILDFMIMMPLGPQLTALYGLSTAQFGLLVSVYTFSAGLSGLLATLYVDRLGRKRLLLLMYGLFALATLACGLSTAYGPLLLARAAAGMFGGVLSALSQTIVADVVPFERRGRAMAVVMTAFSVSTVAGVPIGLFLAAHLSWQAPFLLIALMACVLQLLAWRTLPRLDAHVAHVRRQGWLQALRQVLVQPNHLRALALSGCTMMAGFVVIPYITLYVQANAGLRADQVPWIYLCGGVATLLTARQVGRWTDRRGKGEAFRTMALMVAPALVAITVTAGLPVWGVVVVSTLLFMTMNGRMIPGMALVSSAADPRWRGTFMTLNSAVQSASMGLAALIGGMLIGRDAQGQITHYWVAGLLGALLSLLTLWLSHRVKLHAAPDHQTSPR
jgi:predicted MFS family arabinose efflux permease